MTDLPSIAKVREQELERAIQGSRVPAHPLRAGQALLQLQPGYSLLYCTEGLSEARGVDDREFGAKGLHQVCGRQLSAPIFPVHAFSAIRISQPTTASRTT